MIRVLILAVACLAATGRGEAAPRSYQLDSEESTVGFSVGFGPDEITGTMPVRAARMTLDFERAAGSSVDVTLDASGAVTNIFFATQALRAPKVLDTGRYPDIRFLSRAVARQGDGARVSGDITIRGVTRPVDLDVVIYRRRGSDAGDLSRLTLLLTGSLSRSAFGASGWDDLVGDRVDLRIVARVTAEQ